ncbi:hypothetical protein ABH892_000736 [Paenibacillus sp. RC254]|nr:MULTISPECIES: hypothetical protein [unclassified Paenibacillus]
MKYILRIGELNPTIQVAPYVGAWIEISTPYIRLLLFQFRSLRSSVN